MQPNKDLTQQRRLVDMYVRMREHIIRAGFASEIDWQNTRSLLQLTENEFLTEGAWIILSSGMREKVIRRCFGEVSQAFMDWVSADAIAARRAVCEEQALQVFNHPAKIKAIGSLCERVAECGFHQILQRIELEGAPFLQTFDFIGPITSLHLAKNIGFDVVKPDRHLVRIAGAANCSCPEELCGIIAEITGDKLSVIDLVLWRYAALNPNYEVLIKSFK